jgi:hypothetical protein
MMLSPKKVSRLAPHPTGKVGAVPKKPSSGTSRTAARGDAPKDSAGKLGIAAAEVEKK